MRKKRQKHREIMYKIIILILLILLILLLFFRCGENIGIDNKKNNIKEETVLEDDNRDDKEEIKEDVSVSRNGSIAIPGYEILTLKANIKEQSIALKNPKENDCYFKIQLILEDGTVLWESGYIKPNEVSENIVLNRELKKGVYNNVVLKYSCFKMDKDYTPLNSAITKLTLQVK